MGYITKLELGTDCGFGSQMSQYASLYAIAKLSKNEPILIKENFNNTLFGLLLEQPFKFKPKLFSIHELKEQVFYNITPKLPPGILIGEIDKNLYHLSSSNNYVIRGDLGFFKYFDLLKDDIIKMYTFTDEIQNKCNEYLQQHNQDQEITVSIGFRRDDGGGASLILSLDYYYAAIQKIKELIPNTKLKFFIFSGSPLDSYNGWEWVKSNLKLDNVVYAENLSKYEQMCLMTLCDHNIIANSSFHWWGAYLNRKKNKKVICPFNYLKDVRFDYINGKWFPEEWIPVNVD
jgi:hypothetical protein